MFLHQKATGRLAPVGIFKNHQIHSIIKDSGFLHLSILPTFVLGLALCL